MPLLSPGRLPSKSKWRRW